MTGKDVLVIGVKEEHALFFFDLSSHVLFTELKHLPVEPRFLHIDTSARLLYILPPFFKK